MPSTNMHYVVKRGMFHQQHSLGGVIGLQRMTKH